jgi:hypothetical protein
MKISYAITVKDELVELDRLLFKLENYKRDKDEIVVIYDSVNGAENVNQYLRAKTVNKSFFRWHAFEFKNNFSELKNYLIKQCTGDYIVNLDADEYPHEYLISILPTILESNPETEVYRVPRVNTVKNIGLSHIQKWGWNVSKLESLVEEEEFDLTNPQDKDKYELLKKYNLIIEENIYS